MSPEFIRRYYILKIISHPSNYVYTQDKYISLEDLQRALSDIKSENVDDLLFSKLDYFTQKNIKRDLSKIYDYYGVEIRLKRNYGYYIHSREDSSVADLKKLYEQTDVFLLSRKVNEWRDYVSTQNTSLDSRFNFSKIIFAIENKLQVYLKYNGWFDNNVFETIEALVQPLHLKEADKHWFLVAYNPEIGINSFSLDKRLEVLSISDREFQNPIEFNHDHYFSESIGILNDQTKTEVLRIEVANHHLKYLEIKPFHPSQKIIRYPVLPETMSIDYFEDDTWGEIEVRLKPNYEFLMELLKFNRWMKVKSPQHVREYVKKNIEYISNYYK